MWRYTLETYHVESKEDFILILWKTEWELMEILGDHFNVMVYNSTEVSKKLS